MRLRFTITKKFVLAFLGLSIIPLSILGFSTLEHLRTIGQRAIESSTAELEQRARESLELRAIELARRVQQLLKSCEADLITLSMIPRDPETYRRFSMNHRGTIWTREGTNARPYEVHLQVPLYREVAFIDRDGRERIRVESDRIVGSSELRDVSHPANTTYKSERYFAEAAGLDASEIYVSHVTGWYVTRKEQLGDAERPEDAVEGRRFEGVVRFAMPCFDSSGMLEGVAVLSLDHRHLMELTQHILPTEARFVVFPSYSSGNYAFMFDDEGWIISHPKHWDIRGILPDGREIDPGDPSYNLERVLGGEVPFNLDHVSFINPNYPLIAREVRQWRSGVTKTFNVGGIPRVMAYAPILYNRPPHHRHGVFGGITIGVQIAKFQEPALAAGARIDEIVGQTKKNNLIILGATALVAILLGILLARHFTRPILYLAGKATEIGAGHIPETVAVDSGDELEILAHNFAEMAREIRDHQESLEQSLAELAESKRSLEQHSRQLEKQLRVLNNVHYLSQYLTTVYNRKEVLGTVLKTCVEGLGYDRAILYLYDHVRRSLACQQTFGLSAIDNELAMKTAYHIELDDCIPTKVFRTGETIFVRDIHREERATALDLKIAQKGETEFFVFAPIRSRDRVIGVLGADTKTSRREISEIDVESLQILASDASRAIERSELYAHLLSERNFVRSIVNHMTSGIITLDDSGKITWFNPYSERVFGIARDAALGRHYGEVFQAMPSWVAVVERYVSGALGDEFSVEHRAGLAGGKERVLEVHFSGIQHETQPGRTVLVFIRDITQRKLMEDHIRRSDRLVSLGVLAAGVAHEMRNPLTGISLLMDDLHDHLMAHPQERELIERSLQEIDRLENLINGLLDYAVPSKRVTLEKLPLDSVVQNTLFLVRKVCKNQDVALTVNKEEGLPLIRIDPEKLQQALLNLLLNAVQAMPHGGHLTLDVKRVGHEESILSGPAVRIIVADSGKGIAPEDIPYIFDPFFTRTPSGSGLGLAIVHSIVEEHGGRISVSSQPGMGATFWLDLPVTDLESAKVSVKRRTGSEDVGLV